MDPLPSLYLFSDFSSCSFQGFFVCLICPTIHFDVSELDFGDVAFGMLHFSLDFILACMIAYINIFIFSHIGSLSTYSQKHLCASFSNLPLCPWTSYCMSGEMVRPRLALAYLERFLMSHEKIGKVILLEIFVQGLWNSWSARQQAQSVLCQINPLRYN